MSDFDLVGPTLNKKKSKQLFFHAETSAFNEVRNMKPPTFHEAEVRAEEVPIDPYKALDEKNKAFDELRLELALTSTEDHKLIKHPHKASDQVETITAAEMPRFVREATERAILKKSLTFKKTHGPK